MIFAIYTFLIVIIVIQYFRYRILVKEKTHDILHRNKEQTRLAIELEHALREKKNLEDIVQSLLSDERYSTARKVS